MRSPLTLLSLFAVLAGVVDAGAQSTATIVATASIQPRTSLTVSSNVLRFEVSDPAVPATAAVDFSAGVRAGSLAQIVLSVYAERPSSGPAAGSLDEAVLALAGGAAAGAQPIDGATTAAHWTGGGQHSGHLVFELRALAPGVYEVPLRFILSVP